MRHRHGVQARWLHTRISETLEDALKREARRRRLPVSLLVRHVLEGALDLVEDLVETGLGVPQRPQARSAGDDVYGWQELILNRPAACTRCAAVLATGAKAYRGLRDGGGATIFQCPFCVRRLRQRDAEHEEEAR